MKITKVHTLCIPMTKIKEDENFVWYRLEISIETEIPEDYTIDKRGRKWPKWNPRHAMFKFNKKEEHKEKAIEFIKEKTEPYFLENEQLRQRLWGICLVKMLECKKNNNYPETLLWASG